MDWQKRFPQLSVQYNYNLTSLDFKDSEVLSNILDTLDSNRLLDNNIFEIIVRDKLYDLDELNDLIITLNTSNYLNKNIVKYLWKSNSLESAFLIFQYSKYQMDQENFPAFIMLANLLDNPLCQTIFQSRLRVFSDYSTPSEPLNSAGVANTLINQLLLLEHTAEQIEVFFDYFAAFRPFPGSQKYMVFIDVDSEVSAELDNYCEMLISEIETVQDYKKVVAKINNLRENGGNDEIFNYIKYDVASSIEEQDMCSLRSFKDHMQSIKKAVMRPQPNLQNFKSELEQSKGFKQLDSVRLSGFSIIVSPPPKTDISNINKDDMKVDPLKLTI